MVYSMGMTTDNEFGPLVDPDNDCQWMVGLTITEVIYGEDGTVERVRAEGGEWNITIGVRQECPTVREMLRYYVGWLRWKVRGALNISGRWTEIEQG